VSVLLRSPTASRAAAASHRTRYAESCRCGNGHVAAEEVDLGVDALTPRAISDDCHDGVSGVDQFLDLGVVGLRGSNPVEPGLPEAVDIAASGV
jgi:hypothetical protein